MITYTMLAAAPGDNLIALQQYAKWRVRQVSVEEATQVMGEAFRWMQFCNNLEPGDALWFFKSPLITWQQNAGRAGFYIYRGGKIVDVFVSLTN
jgi:hypothetical protein